MPAYRTYFSIKVLLLVLFCQSIRAYSLPSPDWVIFVASDSSLDAPSCGTSASEPCSWNGAFWKLSNTSQESQGVVEVRLHPGVYNDSLTFSIDANLTLVLLTYPYDAPPAVISFESTGVGKLPIITTNTAPIFVSNIIVDSLDSPFLRAEQGTTWMNVTVTSNRLAFYKHGLLSANIILRLLGCNFSHNEANIMPSSVVEFAPGHRMFTVPSEVTIADSVFNGNRMVHSQAGITSGQEQQQGGALSIACIESISQIGITISNTQFVHNGVHIKSHPPSAIVYSTPSVLRGGAIAVRSDCKANILVTHSLFDSNYLEILGTKSVLSAGGAVDLILLDPASNTSIENSIFRNNTASAGSVDRDAGFFPGACRGGAISVLAQSAFFIRNSTFEGNQCQGGRHGKGYGHVYGGAVAYKIDKRWFNIENASVVVEGSRFLQNTATGNLYVPTAGETSGGALYAEFGRAFVVSNSHFRMNSVFGEGKNSDVGGAGGAVLARFVPANSTPMDVKCIVQQSSFDENAVHLESAQQRSPAAGGATYFDLTSWSNPNPVIRSCNFSTNIASGVVATGGAIYMETNPTKVSFIATIENSTFITNEARGRLNGRGGAVSLFSDLDLHGQAIFSGTVFTNNSAKCDDPDPKESSPCGGGAVFASVSAVNVLNSIFLANRLGRTTTCAQTRGGAIFAKLTLNMNRTVFRENFVVAAIPEGGAVFARDLSSADCDFVRNRVEGLAAAHGGAISVKSHINLTNARFIGNSVAALTSPDYWRCALPTTHSIDVFTGGAAKSGCQPGTEMRNVTLADNAAPFGGALACDSLFENVTFFDVSVQNCTADGAGGGFYIANSCKVTKTLINSLLAGVAFKNCTARLWGDDVATNSYQVVADRALPMHWAPGEQMTARFAIIDGLGQQIFGTQKSMTVEIDSTNSSPGIRFRSGSASSKVFSDDDGFYSFADYEIIATALNETAKLIYSTDAEVCGTDLTYQIYAAGCLPSHFAETDSNLRCSRCDHGQYRLSGTKCRPCNDEEDAEVSGEGGLGCLVAPEEGSSERNWTIARGFYPVPSFEGPDELLKCPNNACLPFICSAHVGPDLLWYLNCSKCPVENSTVDDCHCAIGHVDRLCSRCVCSKERCFFAAGGEEERQCILCRSPSTFVIVLAVAALQVSLVVFLLFKLSALALLLSEVVVVVVLILVGVGESWMLQLVLVLGLLFIISALSQRTHRSRHAIVLQHESDLGVANQKADEEEARHKLAARTAAIAKIAIFFFQTTASLVKSSAWPHWMLDAMSALNAVNLRVSGLECLIPGVFSIPWVKLLVQMGIPWFLALNMVLAALLAGLIKKLDLGTRLKRAPSKLRDLFCSEREPPKRHDSNGEEDDGILSTDESEPLISSANEDNEQSSSSIWSLVEIQHRVQFSVLFLISASYFELTNVVLEILRPCTAQGYMANFPWIPCTTGKTEFFGLQAIGTIFLLVYTLGIPAFFAALLFKNRRHIHAQDPLVEAKYGFLFESYRHRFFWWELIWLLRRVLLSVAVSMLVSMPAIQTFFVILVLLGSILVSRAVMPFSSRDANLLDIAASGCLLVSFVVGQVQATLRNGTTAPAVAVQNSVFVTNALVTMLILGALLLPAIKSIRHVILARIKEAKPEGDKTE